MSLNACVRVVYEFVYVFPYPSDPLISRLTYPSIVGCQRLCIKLFFYCVNPDRIKQIEFGKNINLLFFSTNTSFRSFLDRKRLPSQQRTPETSCYSHSAKTITVLVVLFFFFWLHIFFSSNTKLKYRKTS